MATMNCSLLKELIQANNERYMEETEIRKSN